MSAQLLLPEILGIIGIDTFLVLSILACLFEFPVFLQYIYHASAFVGFGQLWANYVFAFGEETRFLIYAAYLVISLANVVFVNGYLVFVQKKRIGAMSFLCCITIPFALISFSAASCYVNKVAISIPLLPQIPIEMIGAILAICVIVLAISVILSMHGIRYHSFSDSKKKKEVKKG